MIARAGSGWQTVLADLSLILFMATAAAISDAPAEKLAAPTSASLPALAQPVAVWTASPGGPPLADWLRQAGVDPRLQLTILAPQDRAADALALAASAGKAARILLEPSEQPIQAMLGYDQAGLAHSLQPGAVSQPRTSQP